MAGSFTISQQDASRTFTITQDGVEKTFVASTGVGPTGSDGSSGTTVSITPPSDPEAGQFWYDPEDAVMSFWTGSEWVTEEVAITSGEASAFANALIFA